VINSAASIDPSVDLTGLTAFNSTIETDTVGTVRLEPSHHAATFIMGMPGLGIARLASPIVAAW
jgi:hypothetical protein